MSLRLHVLYDDGVRRVIEEDGGCGVVYRRVVFLQTENAMHLAEVRRHLVPSPGPASPAVGAVYAMKH